jgi:hypothetical protein
VLPRQRITPTHTRRYRGEIGESIERDAAMTAIDYALAMMAMRRRG